MNCEWHGPRKEGGGGRVRGKGNSERREEEGWKSEGE